MEVISLPLEDAAVMVWVTAPWENVWNERRRVSTRRPGLLAGGGQREEPERREPGKLASENLGRENFGKESILQWQMQPQYLTGATF